MNELQKQYVNYKGLNCSGLKIALFEYFSSTLFPALQIGNPFNVTSKEMIPETNKPPEPEDDNHPYKCGGILMDMCIDATITFLPQTNEGVRYAIANGYHIASFSGGNFFADNDLEQKLVKSCYLMCGAGNNADKGENPVAKEPWWMPVGAYMLVDGKPEFEYYSSYGAGAVKMCGLTNLNYEPDKPPVRGTSFATPFNVGLVAQFYMAYRAKHGFFPLPVEAGRFVRENCRPINNEPLKEGRGLLVLPDFSTYDFGATIKIPTDTDTVKLDFTEEIAKGYNYVYVNGEKRKLVNPPIIINGKSTVELTVLREIGVTVDWHDKERTAVIKLPK